MTLRIPFSNISSLDAFEIFEILQRRGCISMSEPWYETWCEAVAGHKVFAFPYQQ